MKSTYSRPQLKREKREQSEQRRTETQKQNIFDKCIESNRIYPNRDALVSVGMRLHVTPNHRRCQFPQCLHFSCLY